jgi:general secretion pathway protein I
MTRLSRQAAFTLVEVLVALFVVALGMGALMATLTSAADTTSLLRERSLAQWIALNRISETRLKATQPAKGKTDGEIDYADGTWHWQQEVTDPGVAGILRIDVTVSRAGAKDGASLATATGFYGLSVAAPSGLTPDWTAVTPPAQGPAAPATASGTPANAPPVTPTPGTESAK